MLKSLNLKILASLRCSTFGVSLGDHLWRYSIFLFSFLFISFSLNAQKRYYTDRYQQYRIFYVLRDSTHYDRTFYVEDSISGSCVELQLNYLRSAYFRNGFIDVRESDMHALYTADGKLLAHFCHYTVFYPDDSLALANLYGRWQLFNLKGELIASNERCDNCKCADPEYGQPVANGNVFFAPGCVEGRYALMDKTGTWLTEPVFELTGNFENGKALTIYAGHKGFVNEKGVFTYSDSIGKINLLGMEKPFPGIGPPYKYLDKKNKIVNGDKNIASPPAIKIVFPPPARPAVVDPPGPRLIPPAPTYATSNPQTNPVKEFSVRKDTTTVFAFHAFANHSHYKILWRYTDISNDNSFLHTNNMPYRLGVKDYFLIDTLSKDTTCLDRKVDIYRAYFDSPFIFLNYSGAHPQEIFTLNGVRVLPQAGFLTFDKADSIIIANNYPKSWSIYNWNQQLIFTDSALNYGHGQAQPIGHHLLVAGKTVDDATHMTLYGLMKPNGFLIAEPVFYYIGEFDSTGTAPAEMCNGMEGRIDTLGMFVQKGTQNPIRPTITFLLTDPNYTEMKIGKGEFQGNKGSYYLKINPYCYDKHVMREDYVEGKYDRRYNYYYHNGKLIAEEDLDFNNHCQEIWYKKDGIKKRVVNKNYAQFSHPKP